MINDTEKIEGLETPAWYTRTPWRITSLIIVLLVITGWLIFAGEAGGVLGHADQVGYAVCHQIDLRSFHIGERKMPLCARCTGMYLGAFLSLSYLVLLYRRRTGIPNWKVIILFVLLASSFAIDGGNSAIKLYTGDGLLYEPNNTLRLITGSFMGIGIGIALFPAINQTLWKRWDTRRILDKGHEIVCLLGLDALMVLLVLTDNPMILYPLSILSSAMVVVLLTIIYTLVATMVLKIENRIENLKEMLLPTAIGFLIAVAQIVVINLIRVALIGGIEDKIIG